jgi:hypothetical protein
VSAGYPSAGAIRGLPGRRVRVFPAHPARLAEARVFVAAALAGCPARETLLTCVSELAANAIAHTASGAGGVFAVEVSRPADGRALVAVTDAGGPGEPLVRAADELAEGGRGLARRGPGEPLGPPSGARGWADRLGGSNVAGPGPELVNHRKHEARESPGISIDCRPHRKVTLRMCDKTICNLFSGKVWVFRSPPVTIKMRRVTERRLGVVE